MHQKRENLDIIFRRITPEKVKKDILQMSTLPLKHVEDVLFPDSYKIYDHFGSRNLQEYSIDEISIRYDNLKEHVLKQPHSIFDLLIEYAQEILCYSNNQPVCQLNKVLNWNSITSRLGQDIFTIPWLAQRNYDAGKVGVQIQDTLDWPAILKTDDIKLNKILEKGLAENHFHLNGSTQSFALSWTYIMNHPEQISKRLKYRKLFEWSLDAGVSGSRIDELVKWDERLTCAAHIRALLFAQFMGIITEKETI